MPLPPSRYDSKRAECATALERWIEVTDVLAYDREPMVDIDGRPLAWGVLDAIRTVEKIRAELGGEEETDGTD